MKKIVIISSIVFIIDLISKIIIINTLKINESIIIIKNFFNITYTKNFGAAFSIMQNSRLLLIITALIILYIIILYLKKNKIDNNIEIVGYSLIIGGLLGNLFDRIIYGYVIDFLDLYILNFDFAIFNIADSSIVIGIILLLIISIRRSIDENKSRRKGMSN